MAETKSTQKKLSPAELKKQAENKAKREVAQAKRELNMIVDYGLYRRQVEKAVALAKRDLEKKINREKRSIKVLTEKYAEQAKDEKIQNDEKELARYQERLATLPPKKDKLLAFERDLKDILEITKIINSAEQVFQKNGEFI